MDYDLGYIDLEEKTLQPLDNPLAQKCYLCSRYVLLPMCPVRTKKTVARPEGFEPPTLCLEAVRTLLPNLARGVANGAVSASWGNSPQITFSFVFSYFLPFCHCFPQPALRFRDGTADQDKIFQPHIDSLNVLNAGRIHLIIMLV
jgi:hypothetical protein